MNSEWVQWSEEKQKNLQDQLVDFWRQDVWPIPRKSGGAHYHFRFTCLSPSLNVELKYALWRKFERGEWHFESGRGADCTALKDIVEWLNKTAPSVSSLLERQLDHWAASLRSSLVQTNQYRRRSSKHLKATQEFETYAMEDLRVTLFRQIYQILEDAYDDREETEKDRWDLQRLGARTNPTKPRDILNFLPITQPWLLQLAKTFAKYNVATQSAGSCVQKIHALHVFSQFLTCHFPALQPQNLDRLVILHYITYLREHGYSDKQRNRLLMNLRTIMTTCAYTFHMEEITKEAIIFNEDFVKEKQIHPRELPEEVLTQVKKHLNLLPTTILRMTVINLSCGLRISELCTLPLNCLFQDSQGRWYLQLYQLKSCKEHIIPLVDEVVVSTIQSQQEDIRQQRGTICTFLFPSPRLPKKPYQQVMFKTHINMWAVENKICDRTNTLFRFQSHQIRHTVAMGWLNDGVPLDVIRRLLNHSSTTMTERYARRRDDAARTELEKIHRQHKTVDYQGRPVVGDPRSNDPNVQMLRKGIRGQTLPVGGCGRLVVRGPCDHANKCLTCPFWLTSTDDLPALKSFYARSVRLKQRAVETENRMVIDQQEHIIPLLAVRIKSLEEPEMDGSLCVDDLLHQLRADLIEAESGLEEARTTGTLLAAKPLEWMITELRARITALEGTA